MRPVELSMVSMSWDEPARGLLLSRQPLSVRKVSGTWTFHPSANFLRMWSGTRKAAFVPTNPGVRAGRLREGVAGSATGAICTGATGPTSMGGPWTMGRSKCRKGNKLMIVHDVTNTGGIV